MYNIFISHSWGYSGEYDNLIRLLRNNPYFQFKDYSVPKDDPIEGARTDYELKQAIRRQMQPASCVIILAGVYATNSKWINTEIDLAKELNKKIIAVERWGAVHTSSVAKNAADEVVSWNTNSIIRAIRGW